MLIFMYRRLIVSSVIMMFYGKFKTTLIFTIFLHIIDMLWMVIFRPFKEKALNVFEIFASLLISIYFVIMLAEGTAQTEK